MLLGTNVDEIMARGTTIVFPRFAKLLSRPWFVVQPAAHFVELLNLKWDIVARANQNLYTSTRLFRTSFLFQEPLMRTVDHQIINI